MPDEPMRLALERARGCIDGLLKRTPVRDVAETLAEIDAALRAAPAEAKGEAPERCPDCGSPEISRLCDTQTVPTADCGDVTVVRVPYSECKVCGFSWIGEAGMVVRDAAVAAVRANRPAAEVERDAARAKLEQVWQKVGKLEAYLLDGNNGFAVSGYAGMFGNAHDAIMNALYTDAGIVRAIADRNAP